MRHKSRAPRGFAFSNLFGPRFLDDVSGFSDCRVHLLSSEDRRWKSTRRRREAEKARSELRRAFGREKIGRVRRGVLSVEDRIAATQ